MFEVFFIRDYKKDEDIEHCGSPIDKNWPHGVI